MPRQINFCSQCGRPVVSEVPDGDNLTREVCKHCDTVHYQNPLIVAGCVAEYQGSILLCRRAIEPRSGYWTVPAGFMELGESLPDAAVRETWEEALARVEIGYMTAVVDVIRARQVHIFFAGVMAEPEFGAGEETLETRLCRPRGHPLGRSRVPERPDRPGALSGDARRRRPGRAPRHRAGDPVRLRNRNSPRFHDAIPICRENI